MTKSTEYKIAGYAVTMTTEQATAWNDGTYSVEQHGEFTVHLPGLNFNDEYVSASEAFARVERGELPDFDGCEAEPA